MNHPWQDIALETYERHMSLEQVYQLQAMNQMMRQQLRAHPAETVMILGVAGGNGLEHIDKKTVKTVYGVDINLSYLQACVRRYPGLRGTFVPICADLTQSVTALPPAQLLIANLIIEYIGYPSLAAVVRQVAPRDVSCIIQVDPVDGDGGFVSDSPYVAAFDALGSVHHAVEEGALSQCLRRLRRSGRTSPCPTAKNWSSWIFAADRTVGENPSGFLTKYGNSCKLDY